jgi:hypothetical protein
LSARQGKEAITALHSASTHIGPEEGSLSRSVFLGGGDTRYLPVSDQSSPKTTTRCAVPFHTLCMLSWMPRDGRSQPQYRTRTTAAATQACSRVRNLISWQRTLGGVEEIDCTLQCTSRLGFAMRKRREDSNERTTEQQTDEPKCNEMEEKKATSHTLRLTENLVQGC